MENRPDDIVASEIKRDMRLALEHVCGVVNNAKRLGFAVTYSTGPDAAGDEDISSVIVARHF